MNADSLLETGHGAISVLLTKALPALSLERRTQISTEDHSMSGLPISELLSQNLPVLAKLEKLKAKQSQLGLQPKGTPEYYQASIETTNLVIEILQENWMDLPKSVKKQLQERLNIFRLRFSLTLLVKGIRRLAFIPYDAINLIFNIVSDNQIDQYLKLSTDYKNVLLRLKSLSLEIAEYGYPLKYKEFEEQLEKNQAALKFLDSIKNEVLSDAEKLQRAQEFEALKKAVNSGRSPGNEVFR